MLVTGHLNELSFIREITQSACLYPSMQLGISAMYLSIQLYISAMYNALVHHSVNDYHHLPHLGQRSIICEDGNDYEMAQVRMSSDAYDTNNENLGSALLGNAMFSSSGELINEKNNDGTANDDQQFLSVCKMHNPAVPQAYVF